MSDGMNLLSETLKNNRYSLTKARKLTYRALQNQEPLSMARLIEQVSPTIDRASVYRTIELFEQLGIIKKLYIGWKYRIELSEKFSHHHHHISCIHCGKITTFEETKDISDALVAISRQADYHLTSHQIELTGICQHCQHKSRTPT